MTQPFDDELDPGRDRRPPIGKESPEKAEARKKAINILERFIRLQAPPEIREALRLHQEYMAESGAQDTSGSAYFPTMTAFFTSDEVAPDLQEAFREATSPLEPMVEEEKPMSARDYYQQHNLWVESERHHSFRGYVRPVKPLWQRSELQQENIRAALYRFLRWRQDRGEQIVTADPWQAKAPTPDVLRKYMVEISQRSKPWQDRSRAAIKLYLQELGREDLMTLVRPVVVR